MELPQHPAKAPQRPAYPEVVSKQNDGVEFTIAKWESARTAGIAQTHVPDAPQPRQLDDAGGGVDGRDAEPTFLEIEAVTAGTASDVKDASAREFQRGFFVSRKFPGRREIPGNVLAGKAAVVAFGPEDCASRMVILPQRVGEQVGGFHRVI